VISPELKPSTQVKYCLYARKSSEDEERQALSIDSQILEMNKIAERDSLEIACLKKESHSAKASGARVVFNEIIADIKSKKYNALLTWNTDRLSRNAGDLGQIVDLMDNGYLVEIRTFTQVFTNRPNDKFLLMILGSQAKLENDNRAINVQRGMRARVEMGLWPCTAPTGYLNSNLRDRLCEKVLDPERAPIVREMFEKVGYEGWTNRQVFFWLKSINFQTNRKKLFNLGSIHAVLKRHFYYGVFEYPRKSGNWYKGTHEPIITEKLFLQVQKVMKLHLHNRLYKRRSGEPFSFVRFMKCGLCGSGITAEEKFKRRKSGELHRYIYYRCTQGKDHNCKGNSVNEETLIDQFYNLLDVVDIDLIGMRDEINKKIDNSYGFESFVSKVPVPERDQSKKDFDLRTYAKVIFEDGTPEERMTILRAMRGKVLLKDKKLYMDTVLAQIETAL
jgi:site-specific DNA recombinase